MTMTCDLVTLEMVKKAAKRMTGLIHHTDIINAPAGFFGGQSDFYLKIENLQKTGSFKVRGALNKMKTLTKEELARGVVCASAGNHAQGVALSAKLLGAKCIVVMPEGAPIYKIQATRSYGAEVVLYGPNFDECNAYAIKLAEEKKAVFIAPFDDPEVIAGQGTIGLEIMHDMPDCDAILVPIGGGGLISGVAASAKAINPKVKIIGVEPENAACMRQAIHAGAICPLTSATTVADGVAVKTPGKLTFAICSQLLDDVITVSEAEIYNTILIMAERMKMIAEGAGAVAPAAVAFNKYRTSGKTVAIVSGGNIDMNMLDRIMEKGLISSGRRFLFKTIVADKPGQLGTLLNLISDAQANVMSIGHDRLSNRTRLGEVVVTLELETRDHEHIIAIQNQLLANGYHIMLD